MTWWGTSLRVSDRRTSYTALLSLQEGLGTDPHTPECGWGRGSRLWVWEGLTGVGTTIHPRPGHGSRVPDAHWRGVPVTGVSEGYPGRGSWVEPDVWTSDSQSHPLDSGLSFIPLPGLSTRVEGDPVGDSGAPALLLSIEEGPVHERRTRTHQTL